MYHLTTKYQTIRNSLLRTLSIGVALLSCGCLATVLSAQTVGPRGTIIRKITGPNDKVEITTNSSRILTIDKKIPRVQVNNPELLSVTPLSATQVQISAKKAGVTQVNLWDEDGNIHTVDVYIYGDVQELEHALKTQFPNSSVKVYRYSNSLVLTGFIDRPDYVDPIYELASDYAPKVINNMTVGGVQQVLLKVKIYEISRTKLRKLGVDFAHVSASGGFIGSSVSGLLTNVNVAGGVTSLVDSGGQTVEFAITNGANVFTGWLDALQQDNIAKILAEPNITAVSGRPASFNVGGEVPVLIPQSLGQVSIEYKPFGTQIDFLPIVLGNGKIRLEVRPRISEIDDSRSVNINDTLIPALTVRQVDTAVELNAGQTFAIAGLIQQKTETLKKGLPVLSDIPYLGAAFRRMEDQVNEIELLILVTPELVDPMDPHEVPACGPGMGTVSPDNCDFYLKGKMEVPDNCTACRNYNNCSCHTGGFVSVAPSFGNGPRNNMTGPSYSGAPSAAGMGGYQLSTPTLASPMQEVPNRIIQSTTPVMAPMVETVRPESYPVLEPTTSYTPVEPALSQANAAYLPQINPTYIQQPASGFHAQPTANASSAGLIGPVGYDMD